MAKVTLTLVRKSGYRKHVPASSPAEATMRTMNASDPRAASGDQRDREKVAVDHWVEIFQPVLEYASGLTETDPTTRESRLVPDGKYRLALELGEAEAAAAPTSLTVEIA
jgi:hypothetical protein